MTPSPNREGPNKLGPLALFGYGAVGFPLAVLGLPLFIHLPTFYAEEIGLSLTVIGLVLLVARLWDGLTDPLVGMISDRLTTDSRLGRYGRRKPLMVLGLPLTMLGGWMLFVPPEGAGWVHLGVWSFVIYLGWTLINLPHQAMGAEVTDQFHERSRITGTREAFMVAGTVIAAALPAIMAPDTGKALLYLAIGLMIALPLAVGFLVKVVPDKPHAPTVRLSPREGFRLLRENKPFRVLLTSFLINSLANGLPATLILLFVTRVIEAPGREGLFLMAYFIAAIVSFAIWLPISKRRGKRRTWQIAMVINCAAFLPVLYFGPGDEAAYLAVCIATGLCLGADLALPASMQADVIDLDTAEGGPGRAGLYFALWSVVTKLALAGAVGVAFPLLDLAGFDAALAAGSEGARQGVWALILLYAALPIALKILAILNMQSYDLTEERHATIKRRIRKTNPEFSS
ncbi:MAG: MFS transporter [Alphaproteobacteria bacterium]|nr:MFS transporter [Alphaproteobacteria bacterium]